MTDCTERSEGRKGMPPGDRGLTTEAALTIRSPADLIAAVPYLLGFHPADSLTVVAMRGPRVVFAARYDLPAPDEPEAAAAAEARHVAAVVARQGVGTATIIGYGSATRVAPALRRLAEAMRNADVTVLDELRVTGGRYWSCACVDPTCCPAEGMPYDPATSAVPAAATFAGQVALPDRASLVARVEPVGGRPRDLMRVATAAAERELTERLAGHAAEDTAAQVLRRAGRAAVRAALRRHRLGGRLGDDETARLGVLLTHLPTRGYAWERTGGEDWQVALWLDVLRRVEPGYAPAPACLLAFAAWRSGQGPLASVALDRARGQDPGYSMAVLLAEVLRHGLPPSSVEGWPVRPRSRTRPRRDRR
jgi:Domain of unknown function (DUF4192)